MSKKVLKRGSAEERWYYTTKEGLDSVDIDDDFDWRRGMELLFEDYLRGLFHHLCEHLLNGGE